jgi:hypothetical protein
MITGVVVVVVVIVILMVFRGPRTWLISPLGRERIGIVQVHATIVSILFAAMWVSATNLLNMLWQLEERAFQEARESETQGFRLRAAEYILTLGVVQSRPAPRPIGKKPSIGWIQLCGCAGDSW